MNKLLRLFLDGLRVLAGSLDRLEPACAPAGCHRVPTRDADRPSLRFCNTGGPRSRVVKCVVSSNLLEDESEELGIRKIDRYGLRSGDRGVSLRELAHKALEALGFGSPEEAWEAMREELPSRRAIAVGSDFDSHEKPSEERSRELVRNALVLGRCCGPLFSPDRPIIWTERRLSRRVQLVDLDAGTFIGGDDGE